MDSQMNNQGDSTMTRMIFVNLPVADLTLSLIHI